MTVLSTAAHSNREHGVPSDVMMCMTVLSTAARSKREHGAPSDGSPPHLPLQPLKMADDDGGACLLLDAQVSEGNRTIYATKHFLETEDGTYVG